MENYIRYVHNLKGGYWFDKLPPHAQNAVENHFIKELYDFNSLEQDLISEGGIKVLQFIAGHLDLLNNFRNIVFTTDNSSYCDNVDFDNVRAIISLRKVNKIRHLNKLFHAVNTMLPDAGIYIGCLESYKERKNKIYFKFGKKLGWIVWMMDFLINRLIPRIPYLENLYYFITKGQFHSISQAEVLGRLVYSGFSIIDYQSVNGLSYFVVMKTSEPLKYRNPSYYPIIKLLRIGKNGRYFGVYKLRTMHPYSEYIQDYVIKLNGYNKKGKPANDFRLTKWGSFFRRLWIDEIPQLLNVIKGEMKIFGLRPLSQVRFNQFPDDLKKERIKHKPGCFPPYVALNMPDDKQNIEAERIYLNDLKKHPYSTDIRYMFLAVYNILANKIRSA